MLDRVQAIRTDSARIAGLAAGAGADLDARVPPCPDWNLRDLIHHLGHVQRFWATNLLAKDPSEPLQVDAPAPGDAELATWMRAGTDALVAALVDVGDNSPCWTWWGEPLTSGTVGRHQVQEAAVHRWDAESAVGVPAPLGPDVAHDGVAEFFTVMGQWLSAAAGSVAFVSADTGGRWTAADPTREADSTQDPDNVVATVRGTASDLVLFLYGRVPMEALEIAGDNDLVRSVLETLDTE
jgi:uncharacterized protein (TIGR03083 family)